MQIDKKTLRALNDNIGKIDLDSGRVFEGFVGALQISDMKYHGELTYSDAAADKPKAGEFSVSAALGTGQKSASASTTTATAAKPATDKKG